MVQGKARVTCAQIGGGHVPLQLPSERRERIGEAPQEPEHLLPREQLFHHHEAHEVKAEIAGYRGRLHRGAQPAQVGRQTGLRGLVHAAMPG